MSEGSSYLMISCFFSLFDMLLITFITSNLVKKIIRFKDDTSKEVMDQTEEDIKKLGT
jgi:hypothetical protein